MWLIPAQHDVLDAPLGQPFVQVGLFEASWAVVSVPVRKQNDAHSSPRAVSFRHEQLTVTLIIVIKSEAVIEVKWSSSDVLRLHRVVISVSDPHDRT